MLHKGKKNTVLTKYLKANCSVVTEGGKIPYLNREMSEQKRVSTTVQCYISEGGKRRISFVPSPSPFTLKDVISKRERGGKEEEEAAAALSKHSMEEGERKWAGLLLFASVIDA